MSAISSKFTIFVKNLSKKIFFLDLDSRNSKNFVLGDYDSPDEYESPPPTDEEDNPIKKNSKKSLKKKGLWKKSKNISKKLKKQIGMKSKSSKDNPDVGCEKLAKVEEKFHKEKC